MTETDRIQMLRDLAEKKNKPLHWYGLAMALRGEGALQEAHDVFVRIHELDRDYVPAWFMQAQVLEEMENLPAAQAALETGIALADAQGDAHAATEMRAMLETLRGGH